MLIRESREGEKKMIKISLTEKDSWNIAQLFKRITFESVAECAVDKAETEAMIGVIELIRKQLDEQGISPR